jgi:hypothetical protein
MTLAVRDASFAVGRGGKIWLDKYIKLSTGIYNIRRKEIRWYPAGTYIFSSADYSYDPASKTLSLSCSDRTVELTGGRNGQLSGITLKIPAMTGSVYNTIRGAMVSAVTELGGVSKYRIENVGNLSGSGSADDYAIPYDLEFGAGSYVYDVVKKLRDVYPGWETFFDDDRFVCQPIPTAAGDPIVLDAAEVAPLVISENASVDFAEIKNVAEVWGMCVEADYYTASSSYASGTYTAAYSPAPSVRAGTRLGFKASAANAGSAAYFRYASGATAYPILAEGGANLPSGKIKANKSYVLKFMSDHYYYLGEYQICAVTKLVSKYPNAAKISADLRKEPTTNISYVVEANSPFCSDLPDVGEIRNVFSGGEYDGIYSEGLALQRAEYENWKTTDLMDKISLQMIEVPWIGVNQKIEYASPSLNKTDVYLIKAKRGSSSSGVMTLDLVKFQPLYPWLA